MKAAILLLFLLPQEDAEALRRRIADLEARAAAQEKRIAALEKKLDFLSVKEKEPHPWAGFKVGSWARLRMTTSVIIDRIQTDNVTETKQTLVKLDERNAVVEIETVHNGTLIDKNRIDVPRKRKDVGKPLKKPETGVETIEVPAGKFRCVWTRIEMKGTRNTTTSKIWTSEEIPGLTVKIESVTKGKLLMKSTTELMEFGKK